jgi:serine/threonine protein phosphatase PrpC
MHGALLHLGNSYEECRGMGATLSLAWFTPGWVYWAHVGDSRIYYIPKLVPGGRSPRTDTYVGWLQRTGQINEREAATIPRKNALQRLSVRATIRRASARRHFLRARRPTPLCTDGVSTVSSTPPSSKPPRPAPPPSSWPPP